MNSLLTTTITRLTELNSALDQTVSATLSDPYSPKSLLTIGLVIATVLIVLLGIALALLPAQRKVVTKRRVRRVRRPVSERSTPPAETSEAKPKATKAIAAQGAKWGVGLTLGIGALLVVASTIAAYYITGTNQYCGQTCHASDPHVALAVKTRHADCIQCHESNPVTGMLSRMRMALGRTASNVPLASARPVDPTLCLRCHQAAIDTTVTTKTGLIVSHKEIVAGGRTCTDCHPEIGHGGGATIAGGMSQCTPCHDGVAAKRTCETCHANGSPISAPGLKRADYPPIDHPAVRVANRNCAACHGPEKECVACHGLVLPHSTQFVQGGHARQAAFQGKDMCMKCHTLTWCGSGKCHNAFSAHNPEQWRVGHQRGTSAQCGSCHIGWNRKGDFCKVCH